MLFTNWILPILIGIVASYLLLTILYNNSLYVNEKFNNLFILMLLKKITVATVAIIHINATVIVIATVKALAIATVKALATAMEYATVIEIVIVIVIL